MAKNPFDLSVLIAGCGSIGKRHARVLRGLGVKDIRVCDPVASQREALLRETPVRAFSSFEEGLAGKPDTVFIGTPPGMHIPMARQAIAAGAHVFCEKPLTNGTQGIDELAEFARQAGRPVMTGLCFRYHDGLRKAKAMLESGRFGRLVSIRCLMGEHLPSVRPDFRTLFMWRISGAFDLTHEVDLAAWYADRPVKSVHCVGGNYSDLGMEAPDLVEMVIVFEDNRMASIHLDFFQTPRRRQTELICTGGVIVVEFARWDRCVLSSCGSDGKWSVEEFATDRDDMFRAEDTAFLRSVATGDPLECGIEEARKSIEIIERAQDEMGLDPARR